MITYNRHTHTFDAMINGVLVASEQSYLAAEEARIAVKQAIIKAIGFLADLMTPPPPPAAPAAKKPSKKTCICACCTESDSVADGVQYCSKDKCFNVFYRGQYSDHFPTKQQANAYLKHLRGRCLCPKCMGWAGDLDAAVHRCSLLGMHCVYFHGEYRTAHNTELEATIALNQLKHAHLRQAA